MNNNIVDINYHLKTLQLKDTTDENKKEIKTVDRTFMNLIRVDVSTQYAGDNIMAQTFLYPAGTDSFISLSTMRGYQPSNYYGTIYISSNNDYNNKQIRALCLDNDYNEFWQTAYTNATDGSILVPLALPCRGVNYIETLENSYLNNTGTIYRFVIADLLQVDGANTYRIRCSARTNNRGYNNFYTVPKGKKMRLVNIDMMYTQNNVNATVYQLVFKKQSSEVIIISIVPNQPNRYYALNLENNNWFYEGDVICYQLANTTATSTIFNTSYEIKDV